MTIEFDVLISFNSLDRDDVRKLSDHLRINRIVQWVDWGASAGEEAKAEIARGMAASGCCAVVIGPHGLGPWQVVEIEQAADRRLKDPDFRIIPVVLPGGWTTWDSVPESLKSYFRVAFARSVDEDAEIRRLVRSIRGLPPEPGTGGSVIGEEPPYRGLEPFLPEHAALFMGRRSHVEKLSERLGEVIRENTCRLLGVAGPSGCGKSSLVLAGLIPDLQQGRLEGSDAWPFVVCRPGANPLENLAVGFDKIARDGRGAEILERLRTQADGKQSLHLAARRVLGGYPNARRLLVVVDQSEELFTVCPDEGLRAAFLANLLDAASNPDGPTVVVLTMRADFYADYARYPRLAEVLTDHQFPVGPMSEDELRLAIEGPAALAGCDCDPELVQSLINDVGVEDQAGTLPLMEYTLLMLWKGRQGPHLALRDYKALGGIEGALRNQADKVLAGLNPPERELCRQIFLRMVEPAEAPERRAAPRPSPVEGADSQATPSSGARDTRRRVSSRELLSEGDDADSRERSRLIRRVIEELVQARLVTIDGGDDDRHEAFTVEIAHETLIRDWPVLRDWINADRRGLRLHRKLTEAAADWSDRGLDGAYLHEGARLVDEEAWAKDHPAELSDLERRFLGESRKRFDDELHLALKAQAELKEAAEGLRKTIRWLVGACIVASALLITAIGLAIMASREKSRASQQRDIANQQKDIANQQKDIATRERDKADHASELSVKLLGDLFDPTQSTLINQPALAAFRRDMLARTVELSREVAALKSGDDRPLRIMVSAALNEGALRESLGHDEEAKASFQTALQTAEDSLKDRADDLDMLLQLAKARQRLGMSEERNGDPKAAEADLHRCVDDWIRRKQVAARTVADAQARAGYDRDSDLGLANTYTSLGWVLYRQKKVIEAFDQYQKAYGVYDQLFTAYPSDRSIQGGRAISLGNMARVHIARKEWALAEPQYAEARRFWQGLARPGPAGPSTDPKLFDHQFNLADCLHYLGEIKEVQAGQASPARNLQEEALKYYEEEHEWRAGLPDVFSSREHQEESLDCLLRLGYMADKLGRTDRAVRAFEEARPIAQGLLTTRPTGPALQKPLFTFAELRGHLLTVDEVLVSSYTQRAAEAWDPRKAAAPWNGKIAGLHEELIRHRDALAKDPSDPSLEAANLANLADAYLNKAFWVRDRDGLMDRPGCEASLEPFGQAIVAYGAAAAKDPMEERLRSNLREAYIGRAAALTCLGRDAMGDWERAKDLPGPEQDLRRIRIGEAKVKASRGDHAGAARDAERLAAEATLRPSNQIDLAQIYCRCARAVADDKSLSADARKRLAGDYLRMAWDHLTRADRNGTLADLAIVEAILEGQDFTPLREYPPAMPRLEDFRRILRWVRHPA